MSCFVCFWLLTNWVVIILFCFSFFLFDSLKCKFYLHYFDCCLLQWYHIVKSSFFKLSTVWFCVFIGFFDHFWVVLFVIDCYATWYVILRYRICVWAVLLVGVWLDMLFALFLSGQITTLLFFLLYICLCFSCCVKIWLFW